LKKIKQFIKGIKSEMHKIRWTKKKEMIIYSIATLTCVIVFGLFFLGLDFLISAIKELRY